MEIKLNKTIKDLLQIKTEEDLLELEDNTGIPADRLQDLLFEGRKPSVDELLTIHGVLEENDINITVEDMLCLH